MIGRIFITSSGYDPEKGLHVKDPYLGDQPSLGACRPDIRRSLGPGDHIFAVSGKLSDDTPQFVMGGFEVAAKMHATEAFQMYPEQRLRRRSDGQLEGNVIVNSRGKQHRFDNHGSFERRLDNYVIGTNGIALRSPEEIARGRAETLDMLQSIFDKRGASPKEVIGRWGRKLNESQVQRLRDWLQSIKRAA